MRASDRNQDGRRVRGEQRRARIIAATLAIVERDGVAGVTHRAVAREAGVPASSAVYYFATLDDLLVAALTAAAEDYARQLKEIVESGRDEIDGIAQMIADAGGTGRRRALAERELTLLAARRPALSAVACHWRDLLADAAHRRTADPIAIQTFVAVADGICARVLLDEAPIGADEIRTMLLRVLHAGEGTER